MKPIHLLTGAYRCRTSKLVHLGGGRGVKAWGESLVYSGTSLMWTLLGQKNVSLLVRCPDFRGCNVHKRAFVTGKCVLIIKVSLFQGVLNKKFHCIPSQ